MRLYTKQKLAVCTFTLDSSPSPGIAVCTQSNKDPVCNESGSKIKDLDTETDQPDTGRV